MNDIINKAHELKIATEYGDACTGEFRQVDEKTLKFFIDRLHDEKTLRWQSPLEQIYVKNVDDLTIDVVAKTDDIKVIGHNFVVEHIIESNKGYNKYQVKISSPLSVGYHDIDVEINGKTYQTTIAVAPHKCYEDGKIEGKKLWGFMLQLYALRSKSNWGIGDFSDLKKMVEIAAENGADLVGINPVNVLTHTSPEDASPYAAVSRLFINPIYIDVEKTKGYNKAYLKGINLEDLRKIDIIDYTKVYEAKINVLQQIFNNQVGNKDFDAFCQEKGSELEALATFQAIAEQYGCNWHQWSKPFKNPNSKEVNVFKKENKSKINFFKFLQYEADRQFASVAKAVEEKNMTIGLYRDLPVGVGQCSVEAWENQDIFIKDAGAGAPPDMFNPKGQLWGLGAFDPYILKQCKYMPMIKVLRANMAYSGALRLDHVMWLMRLFVIPNNAEEGTYIYYNFDEMLNILAIESHINKCTIVGESIGNVPEGFLEKLKEKNIYPISVIWAEKYDCGWGEFKNPNDYPLDAFISISTHDMPPLRMWWFGKEIALQRKLNLITSDENMGQAYLNKEEDRRKLLRVLDNNNLWPEDNRRFADYLYGEDYPEGIEEAALNLTVKSSSKCALVCLEDIFQVDKQQNLPGTDRDQYPNWRRKLPVDIEDYVDNEMFARNMNLVKHGR